MKDKKLLDIVSPKKGKTVEIHGVELTFERFTLMKHGEYEQKGISLESLMKDMETKLFSTSDLIYDLLDSDSKEAFDNSIDNFKKVVDMNDLLILARGFVETIMDAQYISEKEDTTEKK